jgi:glycogen operon protein
MGYPLSHRTGRTLSEGSDHPLGATVVPDGVNFAVYSRNAREMFLLLFDRADGDPTDVIRMENRTRFIWHALVRGLSAGQLYAFKARGDYDPARGLRFNENKLLADPYARAFTGPFRNVDNLLLAYDPGSNGLDLAPDPRDNTRIVPKCIVAEDRFDWQGVPSPGLPLERLVIYETHVKGFTADPASGVAHPGSYLGFAEKIPYLKSLGVNAVELLPVHAHYTEDFLLAKGLTNYWGYNTSGFFAPEAGYGTGRFPGCEVDEFKTLVRELHRAGIEVILDVVYNHTSEGSELGPTMSLRGLDNTAYYALTGPLHQSRRYYMNTTGCGNALDLSSPPALRLVMDSLRYWVEVMRVDGFRFDLASVLAREDGRYRNSSSFFDAASQDPVLCRVKLIAEPWDLGTYEVGNFPVDWSEWNGRFRDTVRRFVKGDPGQLPDLGRRLTGSADLYGDDGRSAYNSINFVTCHDGFTLGDLVSFNGKHNEANLEGNRDGNDDNASWNCGAEGDTDDAAVLELRRRLARNHACCLMLAAGTPMILSGDECLRSQRGNNNAYCQDNPLGWFRWDDVTRNADFLDFFRKLIALTRRYPILQRRKFLLGADLDADGVPDIAWFGNSLDRPAWGDPEARTLAWRLEGSEAGGGSGGAYQLFVAMNADWRAQQVALPEPPGGTRWRRVIDTALPAGADFAAEGEEVAIDPPGGYLVSPRATVLLVARKDPRDARY